MLPSEVVDLNESLGRNEAISSFLLGNFQHTDKVEIFSILKNSGLFPEYEILVQSGGFASPEFVYGQTPFPYQFKPLSLTKKDIFLVLRKELDFRTKKNLLGKFYSLQVDLEKDSLEEIKSKVGGVLDCFKTKSSFTETWNARETYIKNLGKPKRFLKSGIKSLDEKIEGIRFGTLTTLIGFAGAGKSTMALTLAYQALRNKYNVLFISSEVAKEDIVNQILSCHSRWFTNGSRGIAYKSILNQKLSEPDVSFLFDELEPDLKSGAYGKFVVADTNEIDDYSVMGLRSFFSGLSVEPNVIIVDYFQRLPVKARNREEMLFKQTQMVKAFTEISVGDEKHDQKAVILLSQTNRSGYKEAKTSKGMYDSTAIFEVSQLEKDSHLILAVYNSKELNEKSKIGISVVKNRTGSLSYDLTEIPVDYRYYAVGDVLLSEQEKPFDINNFLTQ